MAKCLMSFLTFCVSSLKHRRVKTNVLFMQGKLRPLSHGSSPSSLPLMAEEKRQLLMLTELGPIRMRKEHPFSRSLFLLHIPG